MRIFHYLAISLVRSSSSLKRVLTGYAYAVREEFATFAQLCLASPGGLRGSNLEFPQETQDEMAADASLVPPPCSGESELWAGLPPQLQEELRWLALRQRDTGCRLLLLQAHLHIKAYPER